ncbi:MAG: hypothetical protein CL623_11140 [Arcobacter sp.]|nr:hypothetical protein [Arcobacter sp.]
MIKFVKIFFITCFIFILHTNSYAKEEIKRKILVLYNSNNVSVDTDVHKKLESILNYYGYFCEYIEDDLKNAPEDISKYAGMIYWSLGINHQNPIKLANYISKFKNKKNIILGDLKHLDDNGNNYLKEVNKIFSDNFGFSQGNTWIKYNPSIKQVYDKKLFGFEKKVSFLTNKSFSKITINNNSTFKTVFKELYNDNVSNTVFFAPWGMYGKIDKVFYYGKKINQNKWIIDPFKMIEKVFNTSYPIPDTTTKKAKRIAYIHIDGDGILSRSFNQKYTIENGYNFIKKEKLKTGVSYIVIELDKNGPIFKNPLFKMNKNFKPEFFNNFAKKTFALPFVEPASHTYTHPFNWREGVVAYSINKNAKVVAYGSPGIRSFQEKDKQINLKYEIRDSLDYLRKLMPSNKLHQDIIYWSGDCFPSIRDLKYIDDNNILAFNSGDSRFDLEFNSYSYVTSLSRFEKGVTQIYSSNSNENTYTEEWKENFWRFKNVIRTFENTGYPKRIKPINVYYHFYSFEKEASFNALKKIYKYLKENDLEYIYPSEFIKIAKNFHDIKIEKENSTYFISNIKELRELRFNGKVNIKKSNDITKVYYDKKLDVTYLRIKDSITNAKFETY